MFWSIEKGIIHTKRLEINVVHHCNLSCKGCSHLSPQMPEYFISPDKLYRDLSLLSRHCRTERVSLLGGEPLLHPNLMEIIDVVRTSGITNIIRLVTNGILLHKMPEQLWKSVDEVHVSLYPTTPMKTQDFSVFKTFAMRNSVCLELRYQDYFCEYFLEMGNMDESLVRRIYAVCTIPRESCCHTLYEGTYYKCPQAALIPLINKNRTDLMTANDGIDIHRSEHLVDELAEYFLSKTPLAACRYCLGSIGKQYTPQQVSEKTPSQSASQDELIDWKQLEKLEQKKGLPMPNWLQEAWFKTKRLMVKLPPSVLLSPMLRRSITRLGKVKRNYIRG